jgi:uncharacterized membrane protein YfcA
LGVGDLDASADGHIVTASAVSRGQTGWSIAWGATIGVLGGLIGLGGAEFRLPVLMAFFRLPATEAVVANLLVSLVTVVFALVFRTSLASLGSYSPYVPVVLNILVGSVLGAFAGTHLAARIADCTLTRVISVCLVGLSILLISHALIETAPVAVLADTPRYVAGLAAGLVIGLASSLLGVAGGELIIPTLILLFGIDVKVAGSLSLIISAPTLLVSLMRYRTLRGAHAMSANARITLGLAGGSIVGALVGSALLRYVPGSLLVVFLGIILLVSAVRLFTQRGTHS